MKPIACSGESGINGNKLLPTNKMCSFFPCIERGLALAAALVMHAALLSWLLTELPAVPPASAPQTLPMMIELASSQPAAVAPSSAEEPEPTSPEMNENALVPAKPKIRPKAKEKPKQVKKNTPKSQPATSVANHSLSSASVPANPAQPVEQVTPPLTNANYLHNPAPEYPESAMDRGQEGTVLLKVQVSPAGKPTDVQIYKSSGVTSLDEVALSTVRRWSFVPAKRGSETVSGQVIVPISFSLNS